MGEFARVPHFAAFFEEEFAGSCGRVGIRFQRGRSSAGVRLFLAGWIASSVYVGMPSDSSSVGVSLAFGQIFEEVNWMWSWVCIGVWHVRDVPKLNEVKVSLLAR